MKTWIVTGGVGSGKSGFCRLAGSMLGERACLFSCDDAARELWDDAVVAAQSKAEFGSIPGLTDGSGDLDRRALARHVFGDAAARKRLEAIMHPPIFARLADARLAAQKRGTAKVFLAEVPLYYETHASIPADTVIVVAASREVQRARLMEHRRLDADVSEGMLDAQLPMEFKTSRADVVVWNDGSVAMLEAQVLTLLRDRWET